MSGVKWSGGSSDDLVKNVMSQIGKAGSEGIERKAAEALAEKARGLGLASVDSIGLDLTVEGDTEGLFSVDEARVRRLANEMLAGG